MTAPIKGRGKPEWQRNCNRLRGPGKRAFAESETWGMFDQVRCDPNQVAQIAETAQVLNDYERRSSRNRFSRNVFPSTLS